MVRTVVLVRHGKAQQAQRELEDAARPLTAAGRRAITATYPTTFSLLEDGDVHIWTSPYTRAFQTAEVISDIVGDGSIEGHYSLVRGDADDFMRELSQSDDEIVIAVGHNPFMKDLAKRLLGYGLPFSKGTAAAIKLHEPTTGAHAAEDDLSGDLLWYVAGPDWRRWKALQETSDYISRAAADFDAAVRRGIAGSGCAEEISVVGQKTDDLRAIISFVRPFARDKRVAEILDFLDAILHRLHRLHSIDALVGEIGKRETANASRAANGLPGADPQAGLTLEERLTAPDPQPTLYQHACKAREKAWRNLVGQADSKKNVKRFEAMVDKVANLKWRRHIEEAGLRVEQLQHRYQSLMEGLVGEWNTISFQDRKAVERLRLNIERMQVIGDHLSNLLGTEVPELPTSISDAYGLVAELCNVRTMRATLAHCDVEGLYGEATYQLVLLRAQLDHRTDALVGQLEAARS